MKSSSAIGRIILTVSAISMSFSLFSQSVDVTQFRPPAGLPGSINEMREATKEIPSLANFGRQGIWIENGYEVILLGDKIPIAPAPNIPWAKPYSKGKLKILSFVMINGPGDGNQLSQICRELDCDMSFVLIVGHTIIGDWGKDEAYRLGFLADQAREALKKDYDVILFAPGSYSPGYGYAMSRPIFPDDIYLSVMEKVKKGTGLVLVGSSLAGEKGPWLNGTPMKDCAPALMTGGHKKIDKPAFSLPPEKNVFKGMPLSGFPKLAIWDWKLAEKAEILLKENDTPVVVAGEYGKGKVVNLCWDGTIAPIASNTINDTATPTQYEHGMALTLRALVHAAGKDPDVTVVVPASEITAGQDSAVTVNASAKCRLEWTVRGTSIDKIHSDSVKCSGGDLKIGIPPLCAGEYWLDVIARDVNGASSGWGSGLITVKTAQAVNVKTDAEIYKKGGNVKISGEISGDSIGMDVLLKITDATGRVLAEKKVETANGKFNSEYKINDMEVAPHFVTAALVKDENEIVKGTATFFVPEFGWDDYQNILWPANQSLEMTTLMRDYAGITRIMDSHQRDAASKAGAMVGILPTRMNDATLSPEEVQLKAPKPSEHGMDALKKSIEVAKKYGSSVWCYQDERHCMSDPGMPEAQALAEFREYLKKQYVTIDKLNASWDKKYKSWDEAVPLLSKELTCETKNLAPWVDLRLFVADRCFEIDKAKSQLLKETFGKDIAVGIDGFTSSGHVIPFGGMDIGRLITEGVFNHYCPYGDDMMIASMLNGRMVKFIGWAMSKEEYMGNPWRDLFRGHWGTYRFYGNTYVTHFGWLTPPAFWIEEGSREIRNGIGKLLMGAKRQYAPVAILYSYPSMMTTAGAGIWVEKGNAHLMWRPAANSREAFERMLMKCGSVTFKYYTDKQVADGILKNSKLLIIPHFMGMSLSDETCLAIKKFVNDGGYVVADMAPAVCDEHGKIREKGGLDDLFGVKRDGFAYAQRASDYLVGVMQADPIVPTGAWFVGEWYEKNLKLTDGKALGEHVFEKIPAFIVKDTGKGRAMLLNFLNSSTVRRNGEPEKEDIDMMQAILNASGIKPEVSAPQGCEVNRFVDGEAEYVGIYPYVGSSQSLPGDLQMALGIMGSAGGTGGKGGLVKFKDAKETYDVRQCLYLGKVAEAQLPVSLNAAFFARLPYKVEGIDVDAESAKKGGPVTIKIELKTSAKPGRHIVHLDIIDPDGNKNSFYTKNVEVMNGKAEETIWTAFNDKEGKWKVVAREVVSGKTSETSFRLNGEKGILTRLLGN